MKIPGIFFLAESKNIGNYSLIFAIIIAFSYFVLRFLGSDNLRLNWDSPIFIDGAYRVFLGQVPHIDFSSPVGPVVFWMGGLGMRLTTPTLAGINVGFLIYGAIIVGSCSFFLRNILSKVFLSGFILLVSFFIFSPKMLHHDFLLGYTGLYNVWGYSLIFFLGIFLFCDFSRHSKDLFWKGVVCSVICIQLFLIKNSFLLAAVIFLAAWVTKENIKYFVLGFCSGGILCVLVLLIYFQFNLYPLFRDQEITILSRLSEHPFSNQYFISAMIKYSGLDILYILFSTVFLAWLISSHRILILKMGGAYIFSGYLLCASIMQSPVFILSSFFGFVALFWIFKFRNKFKNYIFCGSALFMLALYFVFHIAYVSSSPIFLHMVTFITSRPQFDVDLSRKMLEGEISPFLGSYFSPPNAAHPTSIANISSIGINNLYNFYYLVRPAKHTLLYWHVGVTFTPALVDKISFYQPELILGDSKFIYLNSIFHNGETVHAFLLAYQNYLNENFILVSRNGKESIYKRISKPQ